MNPDGLCGQDLVAILASMTPCARLYGWLGCRLAAAYPNADHAYASWLRTYSSAEYLVAPAMKEALLDELAASYNYGTPS